MLEQRHEACSFQVIGRWQMAEFAERGIDIDQLNQGIGLLIPGHARYGYHQNNPRAGFAGAWFAPTAVSTQLPAVIGPQEDNRVRVEFKPTQFVKHFTDLNIDKRDTGMVPMNDLAGLVFRHRTAERTIAVAPDFAPIVTRNAIVGLTKIGRRRELVAIIQVPIFPGAVSGM